MKKGKKKGEEKSQRQRNQVQVNARRGESIYKAPFKHKASPSALHKQESHLKKERNKKNIERKIIKTQ